MRRVLAHASLTFSPMNSKPCRKRFTLLAGLTAVNLALSLLPGCASRHTTVQNQQTASVGQQLQDLDKAYKEGTINQQEYEKLRKAIIKKND
jgi:hypothetical protein